MKMCVRSIVKVEEAIICTAQTKWFGYLRRVQVKRKNGVLEKGGDLGRP
jgi:hypothetical protein